MIKIAVDCMGGDSGPSIMIEGAIKGTRDMSNIHLIFLGPKVELAEIITTINVPRNITYEIIDASEVITNEEPPVLAVRRKKDSSLVKAATMVKETKADAFLTTGSTGAFLSAGLLIVGRIATIRRPALSAVLPVIVGDRSGTLLLDCGANMDATSDDLYNYAIMGDLYAKHILKIKNPTIALLNVGTESKKGNQVVKGVFERLQNAKLNFIGNIEARQLMNGPADVVICDGFSGNIALKTYEGVALSLLKKLKDVMLGDLASKIGALFLKRSILRLKEELDYNKHGGGILLGLKGLCVKCHGSATADAIEIAVGQIVRAVENNVIEQISNELC